MIENIMQSDDMADDGLYALVVDDDVDMRRLMSSILLEHGHFAVAASSAEEALAALPLYTFHLAYLDHNLPGMEGLVLGEFLRKNNPHMEAALVTASDDPELEQQAVAVELRFIKKPFDVSELLELPARYIERAHQRRIEEPATGEFFVPEFCEFADELSAHFDLPSVPDRISRRLCQKIADAMSNLRSRNRYTERDRVAALSGLITARVLGVRLPKSGGVSLYDEFDDIMESRGRRTEFR